MFEGPFDLLVYLIEKAEMNIYDIEIAVITGQYLAHIRRMEENDVVVGSEFMVLAATLIDIKSRMLLPRVTEGEGPAEDPRTDLTQKLVEYVRFKKAAAALEELRETARFKLEKPQEDLLPFTGEPDVFLKMDMEQFVLAFKMFIHRRKKQDELQRMRAHIERERVSLETKIGAIAKLLKAAKDRIVRFSELLAEKADRYDRVVTFIALLDMARSGELLVEQDGPFAEIQVRNH
ncbi:MAG: segregation/condensation protein A [Clostridiales Family XIII bacterium]|jgi:segregation and condensation protein A|nr:segregation/condensation protein A [Clostridiales Family XIII bacterium]